MSNSTSAAETAHVDFYYVFTIIVLCVFIAVAFFGNLIVITVFILTKELQTQVNYFLASLALADFLTAIFPMPLWLAAQIHARWPYSLRLRKGWRCADLVFCTASIWNLCAISVDRCLAISWPFLHRQFLTAFRIKCAVGVVWLYSCILAVLIIDSVAWRQRGLLISCLSFYLPTVIIVVAYLTIYISQVKSRYEFSRQQNTELFSASRRQQDLRMAKYMMLLIAFFVICWAGHFTMGTISAFTKPNVSRFVRACIKGMSYLNSAVNPFLYGYVNPKFRCAFKRIICGKICRKRFPKTSRHAWAQTSLAHGVLSRRTSSTKVNGERHSTGSQENAV